MPSGAFGMLREHSQHSGHKVADVAEAIVESHQLLIAGRPGVAAGAT